LVLECIDKIQWFLADRTSLCDSYRKRKRRRQACVRRLSSVCISVCDVMYCG